MSNDYQKDLIAWKLQNEEKFNFQLDDKADYNVCVFNCEYLFKLDYKRIEIPKSYSLLKNEELFLGKETLCKLLKDASFSMISFNKLQKINYHLYEVYNLLTRYKLNQLYLVDFAQDKSDQTIEGVIIIGKDKNNNFTISACNLIYLICLTDCYKYFK